MYTGVVSGTIPCPSKNYADFHHSLARLVGGLIQSSSNGNPKLRILEGEM